MTITKRDMEPFDWLVEQAAINAAHRRKATAKAWSPPKKFDYMKGWKRRVTLSDIKIIEMAAAQQKATWSGDYEDAPPAPGTTVYGPLWPADTSGRYIFDPTVPRNYGGEVFDPGTKRYVVPAPQYPRHGFVPVRATEPTLRKAA